METPETPVYPRVYTLRITPEIREELRQSDTLQIGVGVECVAVVATPVGVWHGTRLDVEATNHIHNIATTEAR